MCVCVCVSVCVCVCVCVCVRSDHFRVIDMDHLLALPKFNWDVIYKAPEVVAQGGVREAVEHGRATDGHLQTLDPSFVPNVPSAVTFRALDEPWS